MMRALFQSFGARRCRITAAFAAAAIFAPMLHSGHGAARDLLPRPYSVSGVAADDRLNIRAAPDASSAIVGSLAPDETGVEVVATQAGWGRVNSGETSGWVAMRFLSPEPAPVSGELPGRLACYGTEPFWSLQWAKGTLRFSTPEDMEGPDLELQHVLSSMTLPPPHWVLVARGAAEDLTAVVEPRQCSDGMSDRLFGLAVTLVRDGGDEASALSGCCSIAPQAP